MASAPLRVIVTCEHGGNRVPAEHATRFSGAGRALRSHRGYDPGSLDAARRLARLLRAPLHYSTISRLVVELNRSLHHRHLFSEFVRNLDPAGREDLIRKYYFPYRRAVERRIDESVRAGSGVLHLSVHSFVPVLRGRARLADVGLLYDPGRPPERRLCAEWKRSLLAEAPNLRVRRNYPYVGYADGFTTYLRKRFAAGHYVGVEIEFNQRRLTGNTSARRELLDAVARSLRRALDRRGFRSPSVRI